MTGISRNRQWIEKSVFWILICVLVAIRIVYMVQARHEPGFATFLFPDDQEYYTRLATRIASGNFIGDNGNLLRGPSYMYFVAFVFALSGKSILVLKLIQAVLGVLSGVCLYHIAKRLFGSFTGLMALAFYALYLPIVMYESTVLMAGLITFTMTCALMLFLSALDSNRPFLYLFAGLLFGWAFVCRPNNLLPVAVLIVYLLITIRTRGIVPVLTFCAGILLPYLLIMLRNAYAGGDLFSITTQGKLVLINSHFHDSPGTGWYRSAFEEKILHKAHNSTFGVLRIIANDISRHFMSWAGKQAYKIYAYFAGFEIPQFIDFYILRETIPLLRLPSISFGILSPCALAGVFFVLRKHCSGKSLLFIIYSVAMAVSVIVFYIIARFRMPAVPLMCVFAGWFVTVVVRQKKWIMRGVYLLVIAILIIGLNVTLFMPSIRDPFAVQSMYNRGVLYFNNGQYDQAISDFQHFFEKRHNSIKAVYFLGRCNQEQQNYRVALKWFNYALMLGDTSHDVLYNTGLCYLEAGNYKEALTYIKRGSSQRHVVPDQHNALARAYLGLGEDQEAIAIWQQLISFFPDDYRAYYHMGLLFYDKGDYQRAKQYLVHAIALNDQLIDAREKLGQIQNSK